MLDVTSKPLVFDADNGGQLEHLSFLEDLERAGTSAIIIEDKIGLKKLFENQSGVKQDRPQLLQKLKKFAIQDNQMTLWLLLELKALY